MTTYQARIPMIPGAVAPDKYDPSLGLIPPDDFVITRNKVGSALSLYGHVRWDRTPYDPEERECILSFEYWTEGKLTKHRDQLAREIRWIMFVLIYLRPGHGLSNTTLLKYRNLLCEIARCGETSSMSIQEILADPVLLIEIFEDEMHLVQLLFSLISVLKRLGSDVVGFDVVNTNKIRRLQHLRNTWVETHKQCPPIPTRIYSLIITALSKKLDEFECVADHVYKLFEECAKDPMAGRSQESQRLFRKKHNLKDEPLRPEFPELLHKYELESYWAKNNYHKSVSGLSKVLTEIMVTAALQIQAFTGMRANEVGALPHYCLSKDDLGGSVHFIVKGRVTKLSKGKVKQVQWVTSESGRRAISIAQQISSTIYESRGETLKNSSHRINSHYLFISPYFGLNGGKNLPANLELAQFPRLKKLYQPLIQEGDLHELEQIDPHRAWRAEAAFQLNRPWTLTSHQMRRSLALYAQRSGLVSLPSLKRQLQHITMEMAMYYGRGSAFAKNFIGDNDGEKHFGEEWQETQPISQFMSYAAHVLLTDEKLFGVHPHWISNQLRNSDGIVVFDREETLKRFKRGEMAYKETLIGGCVKVGECDNNPLGLLEIDCLSAHCKNLVGNVSKLERVIAVQCNTVEKLKRIDQKSPDYRHEKANLDVLKATLTNVLNKAEASKERLNDC